MRTIQPIPFICLFLLCCPIIGWSQQYDDASPGDVQSISLVNEQYLAAEKEWERTRVQWWKCEGVNNGKALGPYPAFAQAFQDTIASINMWNGNTYAYAIPRYYSLKEDRLESRLIEKDYWHLGFLNTYPKAEEAGRVQAIKSYTTQLNMIESEYVHYPMADMPFALNYDMIASTLCNKCIFPLKEKDFDQLMNDVNTEVIRYLNRALGHTGTLNHEEQLTALQIYEVEIHPKLMPILYRLYTETYQQHERLKEAPYFDRSCHLSTYTFLKLVATYIGSVTDASFSYAKGHPEFASEQGFDVMGKIGELTTQRILPVLQDYLYQNTLIYQYDHSVDRLESLTRELLDSLVVDTRKKKRRVKDKYDIGQFTVKAKVDLKTIVSLGLVVEEIEVDVDHDKQKFIIRIPKTPNLLKVEHWNHRLYGAKNKYEMVCSAEDIKARACKTAIGTYGDTELRNTLQKKTRKPIKDQRFCKRKLSNKVKKVFKPLLIKVFEPLVSMPHSCYSVELHFGRNKETILSSNCK